MRLDIGSFQVREVAFGSRTALDGHQLTVDRDEVRQLVLEDSHFAAVQVHLAQPGDSVRIVNGLDVVEPRWKVAGPGGVFPGFVSDVTLVGSGRTHRLAGVAVVEVSSPVPGEQTHFREQVLDMSGPGADFSPFGRTHNVVLEFEPNPAFFPAGSENVKDVLGGGAAAIDYNRAITAASLKVAAHLGRVSISLEPDEVETFELAKCHPDLPRTVCLHHTQHPFLYGLRAPLPFGTVIHPNELFDGALVGWRQAYRCTYWDQNHAVLQELCRRHGRDLNFLGSILFGDESPTRVEKERIGTGAAKLAKLLGAEAAIVLGINGSNMAIDTMIAVQECEKAGIKTTMVYLDVGLGNDDPGFIHAVPEADAIVCVGTRDRQVTLPPVDEVIGGRLITTDVDPHGELTLQMRYIHTSSSNQGFSRQTTRFH
jgi:glycine reductase